MASTLENEVIPIKLIDFRQDLQDRQDWIEKLSCKSWNAHMAFRNKQKNLVERLDPDVAFIQECEDPDNS